VIRGYTNLKKHSQSSNLASVWAFLRYNTSTHEPLRWYINKFPFKLTNSTSRHHRAIFQAIATMKPKVLEYLESAKIV
jgi:hypothetical protein